MASPAAVITDVDSANATRLVVLLTGIRDGSDEAISGGETAGITVAQSQNSTHFFRSITGSRDITAYITFLRALSYHNVHPEPTPGRRTAVLQVFTLSEDGLEVASEYSYSFIEVMSTNDQQPNFTQAIYTGSIAENTPVGTFINITVAAFDFDIHGTTNITFRLLDPNNSLFAVDQVSGAISVAQPIDYDTMDSETQFTVVAEDNDGVMSMSATALVLISITDVNDNQPVFSQPLYTANVHENAINGTVVLNISAVDADSGSNQEILFSISDVADSTSFPFRVSAQTGVVFVSGNDTLDFEQVQTYNFSVVALDQGILSHSAVVPVLISILDVNDNRPIFDVSEYTMSISELSNPGTLVVNVSARDQDSGLNGMVRYSLLTGGETFTLNEVTGAIQLKNQLDFENQTRHLLQVAAADLGTPQLVANVSVLVTVINENDNPPEFTINTDSIAIAEGLPAPVLVYHANATDLDMDQIVYTLSSADSAAYFGFTVNSTTGEVFVNQSLDREVMDFYRLVIEATDGPGNDSFSASLLLLISVSDINDNTPQFRELFLQLNVSEAHPPGSFVTQLQADDADLGTNAEITYSINFGNEEGAFFIDPTSGNITVNVPLNHEDRAIYNLIVTAEYEGVPPRTGTAYVGVNVIDVNDVPPRVNFVSAMIMYLENSGTVPILKGISISDDDGANHLITMVTLRLMTTCNVSTADLDSCGNITNCVNLCGELLYLDPMAAVAGGLMVEREYNRTDNGTVTQVMISLCQEYLH